MGKCYEELKDPFKIGMCKFQIFKTFEFMFKWQKFLMDGMKSGDLNY